MTLSGSRQQFLSADVIDGETLRYSRRGGCFVTRGQCAVLFLGAIFLAVVAAALVYFFAPCRIRVENENIEDIWTSDDNSAEALKTLRLPKNLVPSNYKLKLMPYFNNFTFQGNVAITISTTDKNINKIVLNSKDLVILDGYKFSEQLLMDVPQSTLNRVKRQASENATETAGTNTTVIPEEETTIATNSTTAAAVTDAAVTEAPMTVPSAEVKEVEQHETTANESTSNEMPQNNTVNNSEVAGTNSEENITATTESTKPKKPLETVISLDNDKTPSHIAKSLKRISITSKSIDQISETLTFSLDSALKPNVNYVLEINFEGKLDDSLSGFYRSAYKEGNTTRYLASTQFEPTAARKAFPCFDEPQMKATFEVSIVRNQNMIALSNGPSISDELIDGTDMILTNFERTVPMSTYLAAFAISDFHSVEAPYDSTVINATDKPKIKIWTRESFLSRADYAASIAPKIVVFYEEYFDIPYALEKMDLIGVPDFASGAMENWGLITFRENALLVDPKESSMYLKQGVAIDLAHEIAHQWFGNLVTMKWWSDLWLNEGFATYMQYIGVDKVEPNWNILNQFDIEKLSLMRGDALDSTHAVSLDVQDPSEISQKFDEISYTKGGILIRILNHTLTENIFKTGIQNYLKKWKFSNADKDDLWESLTEVASKHDILPKNLNVSQLMDSWTTQKGFPVIEVTRNYENNTMTLTQQIFTSAISKMKTSSCLWHIPVSYTSGTVPVDKWSANASVWMMQEKTKEVKLTVEANDTWLYVNVFAIGYYRVNYDLENWKRLSTALHSTAGGQLPEVFKMQILDDAFNLARTGLLNYSMLLNMTTYTVNKTEGYLAWKAILMNLDYLQVVLETSPAYGYFQNYVLKLINKTLSDIGDEEKDGDSQEKILLRVELLSRACKMEHPKYVNWARNHFDAWRNVNASAANPIPTNAREIVYETVLRNGGRQEFDFLWNKLNSSNDPVVRSEIVCSLPNTRNIDLLNRFYEYGLTDIEFQLASCVWSSDSSKITLSTVSKFVQANWNRFIARYNNTEPLNFASIFGGMFMTITEQMELDQLKSLIQAHRQDLKNASESLKKAIAAAENRIHWRNNHQAEVENWLISYSRQNTDQVAEPNINQTETGVTARS